MNRIGGLMGSNLKNIIMDNTGVINTTGYLIKGRSFNAFGDMENNEDIKFRTEYMDFKQKQMGVRAIRNNNKSDVFNPLEFKIEYMDFRQKQKEMEVSTEASNYVTTLNSTIKELK